MNKTFNQDNLDTIEQHEVNSRILEQASDTAEKLTSLECALHGITEFNHSLENGVEVESYTEEAQDIFNIHYDNQVDELYNLLNRQLEIITV